MKWNGGGQQAPHDRDHHYMRSRCEKCDAQLVISECWDTRVELILDHPVKNRSEQDHQFLIKEKFGGSVRAYLLSMGPFQDVKI